MSKTFATLQILPDTDMGRFTQMALGADRVTAIREEFLALRALAAFALGVMPEALTYDDVVAAIVDINAREALGVTTCSHGAAHGITTDDPKDAVRWLMAGIRAVQK